MCGGLGGDNWGGGEVGGAGMGRGRVERMIGWLRWTRMGSCGWGEGEGEVRG